MFAKICETGSGGQKDEFVRYLRSATSRVPIDVKIMTPLWDADRGGMTVKEPSYYLWCSKFGRIGIHGCEVGKGARMRG